MSYFKKSDLKTGDIVTNTKGSTGVVLKGTPYGDIIKWMFNRDSEVILKYRDFRLLNDDLIFVENAEHCITSVSRVNDPHDLLVWGRGELIYEQEEIVELTMSDLEGMMGCKVKIISEPEPDTDEDTTCSNCSAL